MPRPPCTGRVINGAALIGGRMRVEGDPGPRDGPRKGFPGVDLSPAIYYYIPYLPTTSKYSAALPVRGINQRRHTVRVDLSRPVPSGLICMYSLC